LRRPWAALLVAAAAALACARALREPRPLAGAPDASGASAAELVAQAEAEFAKRPDVAAVRRAESLFVAASAADPRRIDGLVGAVHAKAWLIEHAPGVDRGALAASALDAAQFCERRAEGTPPCDYALAIALGLQARERHSTVLEGLKLMVEKLRRAAEGDPRLDRAGPERVLALVLARAPAWPVGPGDPESAVPAARKAVELFPDHPPNQLALAEALFANGDPEQGRAAAQRALALARASTAPDAPEWVKAAEALVARAP
jgi:tetratricopeptide (TPR) repeat protein